LIGDLHRARARYSILASSAEYSAAIPGGDDDAFELDNQERFYNRELAEHRAARRDGDDASPHA
jgi:hypothetical protein